ncbi:MAG: sensor histidine kinase [Hyphomonadaceae bacterium]
MKRPSDPASDAPFTDHAEMRVAEAHHRIANDLALIAGMVRLQASSLLDNEVGSPAHVRGLLTDAASRIDAVGRLHRTLCYAMDGMAGNDFLSGVCRDVSSFAAAHGTSVECTISMQREPHPERLRAIGLLIHEMVLNALKHGHPTGVPGRVTVSCRHENGVLAIDVIDDGVGFPDDFDPHAASGFGFRMMRELAKQLDATLTFESSPLGVACRLRGRRPD